MITTSVEDHQGNHKPLPVSSEVGGFVITCSRTKIYDFVSREVDMSKGDVDIHKLPTIPKDNAQEPGENLVSTPSTSSSIAQMSRHEYNLNTAPESEIDFKRARQPDLRELIEKRKELRAIRNRLITQKKSH